MSLASGARPHPIRPHLDLVGAEMRVDVRSRQESALYGRDAEVSTLRSALAGAAAGRGRLVLVGGEAGIGKTALVQSLAGDAEAAGAIVLAAGCDDLVATPPYGPWIELVRSYQPDGNLPALPDGLANADVFGTLTGQDALFSQAISFLADLAAVRPLVVVLEDQHWADGASLDLLRFVARRLPGLAALVVVTYRDAELAADAPLAQALPRLAREGAPVRLDLRRLDAEAVRRLVADRYTLPATDEARLVDHLQRFAEGNPFYVEELLRALEQSGLLVSGRSGVWDLGNLAGVQVPQMVRRLVTGQADRLGAEPRKLLQLAAVIGTSVPLDLWGEVAEIAEDDLIEAIEAALAARLLVETADRDGLRFRHALIREAVYEEVVLPRRRTWHRRVAEALAARPAPDPDAVAHHFAQAGDARAAVWLVEAGHRAARRDATRDAIERYLAALERFPEEPGTAIERGWLLWELAEAHRFADPRRALDYLDEAERIAAATGDPGLTTILRWTYTRLRGFLGEPVFEELRELVIAFEALPAADRVRAAETGSNAVPGHGLLAQWAGLDGCYDAALAAAEIALANADASAPATPGEISAVADALAGRGLAFAARGRPRQASELFQQARRRFRGIGNRFMASWTVRWELTEVHLPYAADDRTTRRALVEEYARFFDEIEGLPTDRDGRPMVPLYFLDLLEGNWEKAEEAATAFRAVEAWRVDALGTLGELARLRGRLDLARACLRDGLPDGPATAPGGMRFLRRLSLLRLGAAVALDEENPAEALPWLAALDRWLDWSGRTTDRAGVLLLWARYSLLNGEPERAGSLAREALARAKEPRQTLPELAALRFLGERSTAAGDLAAAERRLTASLALADACAAPYERASTLLAQAELRLADGQPESARADLADARAILEPLGAEPALTRAAAIDRRLATAESEDDAVEAIWDDEAPESGFAPRRASAGGLSPRELEVLRLVARGLTDAEVAAQLFISPRTVARHLQSTYNKLGVNSRTAAAAFAYEHGLL